MRSGGINGGLRVMPAHHVISRASVVVGTLPMVKRGIGIPSIALHSEAGSPVSPTAPSAEAFIHDSRSVLAASRTRHRTGGSRYRKALDVGGSRQAVVVGDERER